MPRLLCQEFRLGPAEGSASACSIPLALNSPRLSRVAGPVIVLAISAKGQKIVVLKLCPLKVKNRPPDVEPSTAMALEPSQSCSWRSYGRSSCRGKITVLFMRTSIALTALTFVVEHGFENP